MAVFRKLTSVDSICFLITLKFDLRSTAIAAGPCSVKRLAKFTRNTNGGVFFSKVGYSIAATTKT